MHVIVDKLENVDKIENEIYEKNIIQKTGMQLEMEEIGKTTQSQAKGNILHELNISTDTYEIIKKLILFLWGISAIILFITIIVTNMNKNYIQKNELGIYKIQGYKNSDIHKIMILENVFVGLISAIIALIGFKIVKVIINIILNIIINIDTFSIKGYQLKQELYYLTQIPQKVNLIFVIEILVFVVSIITINTFLINRKILSKPIRNILKE